MGCTCFDEDTRPGSKIISKPTEEAINLETSSKISFIIEKPIVIEDEDLTEFNKFQEKPTTQDDYFIREEDKKDFIYYDLKNYERKELEKQFNNKCENFKNNHLSKLKLGSIDTNLIENVIKNEKSQDKFRKKIANHIEDIISDKNKYNIEHLTILLVGRKNVGKTTLINYILNSENGENIQITEDKDSNFKTYKNDNVPHLKLIEFRGISYDERSSVEKIGEKSCDLINKLINKKETNNYNDYIHCIWYCISNTRFEESELKVLEKLKDSYENKDIMPIIVVYTQTEDEDVADQMFKVIKEKQGNLSFTKTVAKKIKIDKKNYIDAMGKEELLNETLNKCTKALKGEMIKLMIKKISEDLMNDLLENNKKNEKEILKEVINDFINDYK